MMELMLGPTRRAELPHPEAENGDGIELTLGLAIGGSARKIPKPRGSDGANRRPRVPEEAEGRRKNGMSVGVGVASPEDIAALEAQMLQSRARDAAVREGEAFSGRADGGNGPRWPGVAATSNPNPNANPFGHCPFPVMYPYHQVQYVAVPNGFRFPYVMPCWAPTISAVADGLHRFERNMCQPVVCPGFALPKASTCPSNCGLHGGKEVEGTEVGKVTLKTDSTASSSSGISDHRSGSVEGGSTCSSDSRGNSSPEKAARPAAPSSEEAPPNKKLALSAAQACAHSNTNGGLKRAAKPPAAARNADSSTSPPPLSRMPRVSTTGDGPNGRTISGFLRRYDKSVVSIVCVCHGRSFTPAEFVRHAGGTDISQPLRQIVMVSS